MERIDEIIKTTIYEYIMENMCKEVNNNLTFSEFDKTMINDLGFTRVNKKAPGIAYIMPPYEGEVSMHIPHDGSAKADMLRNTFNFLKSVGWFNKPENHKKFPFNRWGFNPNSVSIDRTQQDILNANEMYKNAEVYRAFYNKNSKLCVLHTKEGYNLCRDLNDRRPLLDRWYDGFKQGNTPALTIDNYETVETEVYPILPNGTLDMNNMMIENKVY